MNYKILFEGYGSEIIIGHTTQKMFNHFKENDLSVSDYLCFEMEDELSEEIHDGLTPENKHEHDSLHHVFGPHLDDSVTITILNENDEIVYTSVVGECLSECVDEVELYDFDEEYILFGQIYSKGLLAEYTFVSDEDFDIKKLSLLYQNIDEDLDLIVGVKYNDIELDEPTGKLETFGKGEAWFIFDSENNERTLI